MGPQTRPPRQLLQWSGLVFYVGALLWSFFSLSVNGYGYQHFRGGSTSVQILDYSHPDYYKVRMTIVTGWELDKGPCGPNCTITDIGHSTMQSRAEFINRTGDSEYFGKWMLESRYADTTVGRSDITDHVNQNIKGRVNNINVPTRWMQEIAQFDVNINSSDYTDIVLEGDSWMDTQLQNCSHDLVTHTCKYHVQQKIRLGIRNDTKKPNESPLVLYKPVYRVRLNEVTRIPIVAADNDGDACRCRSARFVELSLIHPILGTNITSDCVVVISAFEADGFRDGDWGIVNIIVEDVPLDTVTMGGNLYTGKKDNLGQTQVQTLANLTNPEFVAPTPCVNGTEAHVPSYYMYSGTTLRLPLHAQASTENFLDVDIERFHLTSMPQQALALAAPILDPSRPALDNVWMSQLTWKIDVDHSAHYLLQAIAVDDRGFDSNDCSFDVQVEVVNYTRQPSGVGPYFPYFPAPGAVSCQQDAFCALPIYANTDDPTATITSITVTSASSELGSPAAVWVGPATFQGESLYQADISLTSSQLGDKQLCVRATDSYGQVVDKCLQVTMFGPDPCSVQLDVCGKYGICHVNTTDPSTFYCECFIGIGGRFCDKEINPCDYDYCIRGSQCYYDPDISSIPICVCSLGAGPACVTSKFCKPHPCGDHGSCVPLPALNSHRCDCDANYTGSSCQTYIKCVNGGQLFYTGTYPACHCPLGFSGQFCANEDPDPTLLQPKFTDLLLPPKGATIYCEISKPCDFPVYTQGPSNSSAPPNITKGPKTPGMTVAVGPGSPSNTTSLPGTVFQTPITTTSQTPGSKQLCLWLDRHNVTSRCFNIIFQDPGSVPTVPTTTQPHFLFPTLPANTTLPCADSSGCHSVVVTTPDPSGQCSPVTSSLSSVIVFNPSQTPDGNCSTEVMVVPDPTGPIDVCLSAGSGEKRCFNVVYTTTDVCQSVECNQANHQGACLDGQCVCSPHYTGNQCQVRDECNPNPCQNGGICQASNGTFRCFCPLGFGGNLCAKVDVDPKPSQPSVTDQLSPPSGSTISCKVDVPCTFPVFTNGDSNGTLPKVTPGPRSPDINVTLNPTVLNNATHLPGNTFLTPITTTSAVPGRKELCMNVGDQTSIGTSACYTVIFSDASPVGTTSKSPTSKPNSVAQITFLAPTPPGGTTLPCADAINGCHLLVYYTPDNLTKDCHEINSTAPNVYIFKGQASFNDMCVTEVLVLPQDPLSQVCLQAGYGEKRCFDMALVNVSGPDLCSNASCNHPHGACLPDPVVGTTKCVCHTYFNPPNCQPDVCRPNPCQNGGICQPVPRAFQCFCPVGFSGANCSIPDVDPHRSKPKVTDQLGPTPGGTVKCQINIPCNFPVYTSGDNNGTLPQVTPGPISPGLNVTLSPTVRDNSTDLPGNTFLTPVTTTSTVPGQKQLCVKVGNQQDVTDSACFHIIFTDNSTGPTSFPISHPTSSPGQNNNNAQFVSPTPPSGTILPCADSSNGCHFLVYSEPANSTTECPQVTALTTGVVIFSSKPIQGDHCVNEVLVLPKLAPQLVCLQAGSGEIRCLDVPQVNMSGTVKYTTSKFSFDAALCQNVSCNSPHGSCLGDPLLDTTQCLCDKYFSLPKCLPEPCNPNPCQNGGICQETNKTHTCFCRLGFSGENCSIASVIQYPSNPSATDQLGPTPGGTINCQVNIPCHFPIFTTGNHNGTFPQVTPGPSSPDIIVSLNATVADNSTGLPGFTYLTPVTTVSPVPGKKQLCVNIGNQLSVTDSACFHIVFTDNKTTSASPTSNTITPSDMAKFLPPTPPDGTSLPCSDAINGCHFLVYSESGNATGDCPQVTALASSGVLVFSSKPGQAGDQCINEVLVMPLLAPQLVCLQAGVGEIRCLNVPVVNASGAAMCQNVSCNSPHGACLADPSLGSTECVCRDHFSLPRCAPEPCSPNPCQNGGICQPNNGTFKCFCHLGFSGGNCSTNAINHHPQNPSATDQLGPTPGGTINCQVNIPCHFPVFTTGDHKGATPQVTPGPSSPDISVSLNATVADNSTGLPGFTYLTPVTTVSAVPGQKQLCVNIGNQLVVTDSACFHIVFSDNVTTSTLPSPNTPASQSHTNDVFVSPTPPDGTLLPCADSMNGCHFLVYSEPGNASGDCPQVTGLTPGVLVFSTSAGQGGAQCVNEVLVMPQTAPERICLQAGSGETRCLNVPVVTSSGPALCQNTSCNMPNGACLADPSLGTTQCVCKDHFSLPACAPEPCYPNPCQNGGICQPKNGTFTCFCRLGFSGENCSTAQVDQHPLQPTVTDQLGPSPGGTIYCTVNIPCDFPVYTTGDDNGTFPQVTPGPSSPDISVSLNVTVADNSTGLPGFTYLTPVTTVSAVPGQKQLCVNIGNQLSVLDSACYHIVFSDNNTVLVLPSPNSPTSVGQINNTAHFVSPTPPGGTTLPCSDSVNGCHFLVYSEPGNSTGDCPQVSALTPGVVVFPSTSSQGGAQCLNEVLVMPQVAPQLICLQAGVGDSRCFNVPVVNVSGPVLCQNLSCNSPHGACLADPIVSATQCVCKNHFSLPTCTPEPCNPNPCQNGGICQLDNGTFTCYCRLGFSGGNCSVASTDQHPSNPSVTDQLGPTPGGTINCQVNIPCDFPVFTTGSDNGATPQVTPGPSSPDISVSLNATVADNSTGLPGFTYLTPVTTVSAVPGQKQLCVNIGNQLSLTDSACFHIVFHSNNSASILPSSSTPLGQMNSTAKFVSPTPPDGTKLPCSNSVKGCHFLVYSDPGNGTGDCPQVSALTPGVVVFPSTSSQGGAQCVNEVLVMPQVAPQLICLQAGAGETRCLNIPVVNASGPSLCHSVKCNSPHGACLSDPSHGSTQCVCQGHFSLPGCLPEPCFPNPCQNGGICQPNNGTSTCFCPLGFSGGNCSTAAADQHPTNPSATDQLGPTPGGTIQCKVNIPCNFPVFTTGGQNGNYPQVTPGPSSPDISVSVNATVADNSTGLPGFTYLTPVTTVSAVPGQKQLCVNIGNQLAVTDSACFHIIFVDNTTSQTLLPPNTIGSPPQAKNTDKFVSPTPPHGSTLPCSDATSGCHFLVYSEPGNASGDCPQIAGLTPGVLVFSNFSGPGGQCINEVLVMPQVAPQLICLQAGVGETRCLNIPLVNSTGLALCYNASCNSPNGACLADPSKGTTQCVCEDHFQLPKCISDPCNPNPCQNDGVCRPNNGTFHCFCHLGYSGSDCSTVASSPAPQQPSVTDQLGPTAGGIINCAVNTSCHFPVYITGDPSRKPPLVTEGPTSPDINVVLDPTVADNSTGLPGFTFMAPITTISQVPGQKQLCVNIGNSLGVTDSACFHIVFTDNQTISTSPSSSNPTVPPGHTSSKGKFVSPTPPEGSTLHCSDSVNGCHFLVYSEPGNASGDCPQVTGLMPDIVVFSTNPGVGGDQCINEVLVTPQVAQYPICLKAGVGETRCFSMPFVNSSGPTLCGSISCNTPLGACLPDPSVSTTQCVCQEHFSPPNCTPEPCSSNPCQNGAICQPSNGTFQCFCRLGFSGSNCSTVDSTLPPSKPSVTDQLGPTPGGTIQCRVNISCHFPVYTTVDAIGKFPLVTKGPTSPDINVVVDPTVADNSTGLPGFTYLTPVTTASGVPGQKQLCVNVGNNLGLTDSACFHIIFTDNQTVSTSLPPPSSSTTSPSKERFVSPTPPDGSILPCASSVNGCHFLVYSEPGNSSANCPQVASLTADALVFPPSPGGSQCVNEVLVMPQTAPSLLCLQAGAGETRCLNVPAVNTLGPSLCQNVSCNSPHGSCLADPSLGTVQCVCEDNFSLPKCTPVVVDPCQGNPCQNGGICQTVNGTYQCFCALGFNGSNCAKAGVDPQPVQPSVSGEIGPTPGAIIHCIVNISCHFPVYTQGDVNRNVPQVTEGPKSPDIKVTLDPTVAENFTALPGFIFLTPVTVSSAVPGQKQLCVNVGDQVAIRDSACFQVYFSDNATTTTTPSSPLANAAGTHGKFLKPTPPDGSTLPCSEQSIGCHFLVYPSTDKNSSNCSEVTSLSVGVFVFPNSSDPGDRCVKEILVLPQMAPQNICVQAGGDEIRCYNVPLTIVPGKTLCQNISCNQPNGACLAYPSQGTTQCVCEETFSLPDCLPANNSTKMLSPLLQRFTIPMEGSSSLIHALTSVTYMVTSTPNALTSTADMSTSTTDAPTSTTYALTSTTDALTSTTDAPTSTTDAWTSTTDMPTSTTDAWTSTTDMPTSTTDALTSSTDMPTSTTDALTSTTDVPTSTTDALTSTTDMPTSTTDALTSTTDMPTSTTDALTSTTDMPTSTTDALTSTTDMPTSTTDALTSTTDMPTSTTDALTSTTGMPTSTTDALTSTTDALTSTIGMPTSTTDALTSTTDALTSTTDALTSTTDMPTSTTDALTSTTDALTSTTAALTSTTDMPTSTTDALTSTTDMPTSTTDALTSTTDALTSTTAALTSTTDMPTSTTDALTSTTDALTSTTAALTSTTDMPTSTTDALTSTTDMSTSTTNMPTSTIDALTSTTDMPTSTTDALTSTTDALTSTTDALTSTTDMPTSTTESSTLTTELDAPTSTRHSFTSSSITNSLTSTVANSPSTESVATWTSSTDIQAVVSSTTDDLTSTVPSTTPSLGTTSTTESSTTARDSTSTSPDISTTIGPTTTADSSTSMTIGPTTTADSSTSTTIGPTTTADSSTSTTIGLTTTADSSTSTTNSPTTTADILTSTTIGPTTTADSSTSTSIRPTITTVKTATTAGNSITTTARGDTSISTIDWDQCQDPRVWEKAFSERNGKCVCTVNGEKRTVIRPRISNTRLFKAFLIGFACSSSGLILFTLAYFIVKTIRNCLEKRKDPKVFDDEKQVKRSIISCFHCGDMSIYMKNDR